MSEAVFTPATSEITRDRWGRPMVTPPGGGKATAYRRVTSYVDVLGDTFNLVAWKRRQTALGLAMRPDLALAVASFASEPDKHKSELDKVCDQAAEAAASSAKATTGTAIHAFTERLDRGLDLGPIPPDAQRHVDAYAAATAPLTALHIEQMTVCDELQVAGTPDRIVTVDGYDGCFIADLKTGASTIKFGLAKVAAQMGVYAHSQLYNHETNQRLTVPGLSLEAGVVIVSDLEAGTCRLAWIDLEAGWEDALAAREVWHSHARRKDVKLHDFPAAAEPPAPAPEAPGDVYAAALNAIHSAKTQDELTLIWQHASALGLWDGRMTEAAGLRSGELQTVANIQA